MAVRPLRSARPRAPRRVRCLDAAGRHQLSAAAVGRIALLAWVVVFVAYDSVAGIASGLLARHAEELESAEQATVNSAIDYLLSDGLLPGAAVLLAVAPALAWVTAVVAAAVALYHVDAGRVVAAALFASPPSSPSTQATPPP